MSGLLDKPVSHHVLLVDLLTMLTHFLESPFFWSCDSIGELSFLLLIVKVSFLISNTPKIKCCLTSNK